MISSNTSRRSDRYISIPIEIISSTNSKDYSSKIPLHTIYHRSSQFNNHQSISNHLNKDLLSFPIDSKRSFIQSQNNRFCSDSDFIQSNHFYPNSRSIYVNQISNEYHIPSNQLNNSHDRSHSPASERGESPTRPPPPPSSSSESQQQQQKESDFKISKDATNTSSKSNDQQVPSTDTSLRDPNIIALEKLEQIKQNLIDLNQQVESYTGLTRDDHLYKLLDEQALKIMLCCDELINVNSDIKEKRKEMIQNVQIVLAKLELKVPIQLISNSNENVLVIYDSSLNKSEQEEKKEAEEP